MLLEQLYILIKKIIIIRKILNLTLLSHHTQKTTRQKITDLNVYHRSKNLVKLLKGNREKNSL